MAFRRRRAAVKRYVRYNGIRRGLLGGSRLWTAAFLAGYAGRWFSKVTKRGEMPLIISERLEPGRGLVIRHIPPGEE